MNSKPRHAIAARHVFDGITVLHDHAVIVEDAHIVDVVPRADVPASLSVVTLAGETWLAPGFIDVQVNGGGDVLFNDTPTREGIEAIAAAHRRFGTTGLLPTLISDTYDKMARRHAGRAVGGGARIRACSASTSKVRSCHRKNRACTTRRCSARPSRATSSC